MSENRPECEYIRDLLDAYYSQGLSKTDTERVHEHLKSCAACLSEAALVASLARGIREAERTGRGHHPSAKILADMALGGEAAAGVDPAEKARVFDHIKWCRACRETVDTVRAVNSEVLLKAEEDGRIQREQALIEQILASQAAGDGAPAWWGARLWGAVQGLLRRPAFAIGFAAACIAVVAVGIWVRYGQQRAGVAEAPIVAPASPRSWQPLMRQAEALAEAGRADSANILVDQAVAAGIRVEPAGKDTAGIRLYRNGVGHTYYIRDRGDAERLLAAALSVREKARGANSPEVASILLDLGWTRIEIGAKTGKRDNLIRAKTDFARARAIRQRALPQGDPDIGRALCALAEANFWLQDLPKAESLYHEGFALLEKSLGPDHPDVAIALLGEGKSIGTQWRHAEAVPFYERALQIRRAALSPEDPDLSDMVMQLGNLYKQLARYSDAERLFAEAVSIREKLPPPNLDLAMSLDHIAEIYERQGRYAEAEEPYKQALEIRKAALGPDDPDVGAGYHYLGDVCMELGRVDEAEAYYRMGLRLREKLGRDHPDVATSLTDVASVSEMKGDAKAAERLLKRALAIREDALGKVHPGVPHPGVAASLSNLAAFFTRQGKYAEAEPLYARAISIFESSMGPQHPSVASALQAASELYRLEGKGDLALHSARRAATINQESFAQNAAGMTEEDALQFAQRMRNSVANYLTVFLETTPRDRAGGGAETGGAEAVEAANLILRTKGQVSDEIFQRHRGIVDSADPRVQSLERSLTTDKGQLAELAVQGYYGDPAVYQARMDSLDAEIARIETELAQRSADFRRQLTYRDISTHRVASLLPAGGALVEYVRFDYLAAGSDKAVPHYLALVMSADAKPAIVDLGEAARIDGLVETYRRHVVAVADAGNANLTPASVTEYRQISSDLYAAVWEPLQGYIGEGSTEDMILVAPDGDLNTVSFAALTDDDGKYFIEKHPVHYLAAGRDLVRLAERTAMGAGLLAMGDPDFSASVPMRLADVRSAGETRTEVAALAARTRNVRSGSDEMRNLKPVPTLPGTRAEIDRVAWAWAELSREPEAIRLSTSASEERFKAEAPGKRVIHLATHGFFLEGAGENPLLRSGLYLAGANLRGQDAETQGAEDGILTAYEISAMDLEGAEMVVLSACDTGLGGLQAGEGVYGLRRAFQMAGARAVVSALWAVPDSGATADIVTSLYGRGRKSLADAIRVEQLVKIREIRAKGGLDHPYSWGAFVAVGDWR